MNFDKYYKIVNEGVAGKIRIYDKFKNKTLPFLLDCIDLTTIDTQNHNIVKVTIGGQLKLLDLKQGKMYNYVINRWGGDSTERFVTMVLRNDSCAVFDCQSQKLRILPNNIERTFVNKYCEKNYCLVQLKSGEFTFYHLLRYYTLDVRYTRDEIVKLGCKLHWKDVIRRSPQDFKHLPNTLASKKSVIAECNQLIKEHLVQKKMEMSKEDFIEYKENLATIYKTRLRSFEKCEKSVSQN